MEYSVDIKNSRMTIVKEALDGGKLEIYTAGYSSMLVSIDLDDPSAYVLNGTLNIVGFPLSGMASAGGQAAIAMFIDALDHAVLGDLTVGTMGANIIIDHTDILVGQTVNLLSGTIIHG